MSLRSGQAKPKMNRIGYYEDGLLCRDCESKKLSDIENKICRLTRDKKSPRIIEAKNGRVLEYGAICYDDILLFGLGVVFKASASKKFKTNPSLSKRNFNIIRKILNEENDIPHDKYSVAIAKYTSGEYRRYVISMPTCSTNLHFADQVWQIQLGNGFFMYIYINTKVQQANAYRDLVIGRGKFIAADMGNYDESREFKEFVIPMVAESIRKEQNMTK